MIFNKIITTEIYAILSLSLIFALRMFGIFIILPILSTYGMLLQGSNEFLIGLAIGIYGITQAIFQIPFGILSDKIGRKPVIMGGLIIFTIGSSITTITNNIWYLIIGRAIQGIGAVSSPILALLCDLTQEQNRTKAMACLGISVGISFSIALILGPILTYKIGLHGLFVIITILSFINVLITLFLIPYSHDENVTQNSFNFMIQGINKIISNIELIKIIISIFLLHSILMLNFISLPIKITLVGINCKNQWKIYLITIIISLIIVTPFIIYTEKKQKIKKIIILFITIIILADIILSKNITQTSVLLIAIQLFFIGFNAIEAILPSTLSKISPKKHQGTCMGIYSTSQFLGVAYGSLLGGYLLQSIGEQSTFFTSIIISICWITVLLFKPQKQDITKDYK
ncbi:MFS transporter [Blochmannia endosymbiont of Camponotus (Colobopsis) obliquus]|uniref:MFS transporter n=1 Tax=Blochmannia endosymbiont of Camponotus (Colobopsis) obliquus TaxID=1505597 RepID=UPI00061A6E8B|nr:MFS transporter [Blochmannia endosymbiont of Camponotus (Colobopsis) obliquus]AKC60404.1 inner membrane transport protein yajR [Blochmannia endosymbiont of Camponotus (Colobopsis) obliquus]